MASGIAQDYRGPITYTGVPTSEEEYDDQLTQRAHNSEASTIVSFEDLPVVADSIPLSGWLITIIECCERFTFFGFQGPLQNYMQLPADSAIRHGGLGFGQKKATLVKLLFNIWCYITPFFAGIIADQYLGRYQTILRSAFIYIFGLMILTGSSLFIHRAESWIPTIGLVISIVTIGIGTGGIKVNVNALLAEQYVVPENTEVRLRDGTRARIDYDATIQRMFLIFYMLINVGSMSVLATAEIEQKYGFFWTYALALVAFFIGTAVLVVTKRLYKQSPSNGSVIINVTKIIYIAIKSGMKIDSARPENLSAHPPWDDQLVDDVRQALDACRVFVFFPFFWCAYSQIITNLISQAGTMRTGSIPNDVLGNIDSATIIIMTPIFDRIIYPFCHRRSINLNPIRRMALGFFFCALAMAYTSLLQRRIYRAPPCYDHPLSTDCEGGLVPNNIHVLYQSPIYILIGIAEILLAATGLEFAYASAPQSMKSLVMAMFLLTNAAGMVLAIGFGRLTQDPLMVLFYDSLTVEVFLAGVVFCYVFRSAIGGDDDHAAKTVPPN